MKYDFTSILERHGKDAIAVDGLGTGFAPSAPKEGFDAIPMWVADMNFATVPTVQEHIIQRAQHPMFGYFNPRSEYFDRVARRLTPQQLAQLRELKDVLLDAVMAENAEFQTKSKGDNQNG